ncbi:hypothetical protein [uncultured Nostoc sp.]|uniref:hypothetical protein n=1 Tax=uncultured Nostoc sp. TaxID=340711 RepID=UPI0035CA06B0
MSIQDQTIGKIRPMPESLVREVSDFIDFLLMKHSGNNWELWLQFSESVEMSQGN